MMTIKTRLYDVPETLRTLDEISAYLEACMEEADGDAAFIAKALEHIACAQGTTEIALQTGLSRESLYQALSREGSPSFDTVLNVVSTFGLKLSAGVCHEAEEA